MLPSTPSKKTYTDELWSEANASNTHRDRIVPEDLTLALQNIGSRVRKSVTEGYNIHHLATFSVPPTPCPSPAKVPCTQTTPTPIFRSSNDAFNSVFPPGSSRVPLTPSPKKRRRPEEFSNGETRQIQDSDVDMGAEGEDDDDRVMVVLGPDANSNLFSLPRKTKPLRRSVLRSRTGVGISNPSSLIPQDVEPSLPPLDVVQGEAGLMDFSEEKTN